MPRVDGVGVVEGSVVERDSGYCQGGITGQNGGKLRPEISPWCGVVVNWYWNWVLELVVKLVMWWSCISKKNIKI